jgi:hypothetical protein
VILPSESASAARHDPLSEFKQELKKVLTSAAVMTPSGDDASLFKGSVSKLAGHGRQDWIPSETKTN